LLFRTLSDRQNLVPLVRAMWAAADARHLGLIAAGVAFYAMLGVFPGLAILISVWGFFSDPVVMRDYVKLVHEFVPADAYHLIEDELTRMLSANQGRGLAATALTFGVGLWSSWSAVNALIDGLNAVHAQRHRSGFWRYVYALVLTMALMGLLLSALATMVAVPTALAFAPPGQLSAMLLKIVPPLVMFVSILAFLGIFYRWGPNHDSRPSWVTPGGVLASALWAIVSAAFTVYLSYFSTYSRVYGSIGAVVALLVWFYLSAYIILLGGVLNAELGRLAARARQGAQ
jgi:membrane protein